MPAREDDPWTYLPLTDLSYQILLAVSGTPRHGYAILQTISGRTGNRLQPETGTLYTAIRRLVRDGLLVVEHEGGNSRRGRTYRPSALGLTVLRLESRRLASLVSEARDRQLLEPEGEGA